VVGGLECRQQTLEPVIQLRGLTQTVANLLEMESDDGREALAAVECPPDLSEVEAEAPHRGDLVEPLCLLGPVPPMARTRPRGGHEQPDLVVVVQRPHGDAGCVGEFADAPFPVAAPDFRFRHRREPTT
jgi:hypothetical protein